MKKYSVPIQISHRSKSTTSYASELQIADLTAKARWLRALKCLLAGLTFGAITAFIPILHFVLVPVAVGCGLLLFYKNISNRHVRSAKELLCPDCGENFKLQAAPFNWPIQVNCISCRSQIKIALI